MPSAMTRRWLLVAFAFLLLYGSFTAWRVARGRAEARSGSADSIYASALADGKFSRSKDQDLAAAPVAPFMLTDQAGQPFDTGSLRGRVWVASFFFTSCPAICKRLNQALSDLQLADPDSDVHFVSITCDPENDTPELLDRYARLFKADPRRWTFLTGELATIHRIGVERFQVAVERETHSDRTFAIDRAGRIRARYRVTEPDQFEKLKQLLAKLETEPAPIAADEAENKQPADSQRADEPVQAASDSAPAAREGAGS